MGVCICHFTVSNIIIFVVFMVVSSYLVQKELFISSILPHGLTKEYLSLLQL